MSTADMSADGGMAGDGASASADVTGTSVTTYVLDNGMMRIPDDLTMVNIAALVPDGKGGYTPIAGKGSADGTFVIPNVPMQSYYLQFGSDTTYNFTVTNARALDLGYTVLGRPDVQPSAQTTTTFSTALTGLSPWAAGDHVEAFSPGADSYSYDVSDPKNPPATGATTVNASKLAYADAFWPNNLIDSTKGDQTYVYQMSTQMSPSLGEYNALSKAMTTGSLSIKDGVDNSIGGALTDVPHASFSAHLALAQFELLAAAGNPKATVSDTTFSVLAQPGGLGYGDLSSTADLLEYYPGPGASDVDSGMLSYGNPFPASWGLYGSYTANFSVSYTVPGVAMPVAVTGSVAYAADLSMLASSGVTPPVGPVQNLKVNGMPATVALSGITASPTISFDLPSVGTANSFVVYVLALTVPTGMPAQADVVASFYTQGNSVTVPPGVLHAGTSYVVRVSSIFAPRDSFDAPYRSHFPNGAADALSGLLTP